AGATRPNPRSSFQVVSTLFRRTGPGFMVFGCYVRFLRDVTHARRVAYPVSWGRPVHLPPRVPPEGASAHAAQHGVDGEIQFEPRVRDLLLGDTGQAGKTHRHRIIQPGDRLGPTQAPLERCVAA